MMMDNDGQSTINCSKEVTLLVLKFFSTPDNGINNKSRFIYRRLKCSFEIALNITDWYRSYFMNIDIDIEQWKFIWLQVEKAGNIFYSNIEIYFKVGNCFLSTTKSVRYASYGRIAKRLINLWCTPKCMWMWNQ